MVRGIKLPGGGETCDLNKALVAYGYQLAPKDDHIQGTNVSVEPERRCRCGALVVLNYAKYPPFPICGTCGEDPQACTCEVTLEGWLG